ncbi:MAG: HD domain-containing protein [Clostridia bacterium]
MEINLNDILYAFSYAIDCVEHELLGTSTNHGKRVAYISIIIGKKLALNREQTFDLAALSILHDNALTEYISLKYNQELFNKSDKDEIGIHCTIGEKNIKGLPFYYDPTGVILYHHENADGTGPFSKKESETPLMAQIIHLADILDATLNLDVYEPFKEKEIEKFLLKNKGKSFSSKLVDIFLESITVSDLIKMQGDGIDEQLKREHSDFKKEFPKETLFYIASMFATIIDYKSEMTSAHSLGVATKALKMSKFYQYDDETIQKMYLAGAVHDVGKLVISNDILEKPDKLNDSEFSYVKTHAFYTYSILSKIRGFEDITKWASLHHEKLDGSGYPFGKMAVDLDKNSRLMGCLDIYQALREKRSYKATMTHNKAIEIMMEMANDNKIDINIVGDIDKVFYNDMTL